MAPTLQTLTLVRATTTSIRSRTLEIARGEELGIRTKYLDRKWFQRLFLLHHHHIIIHFISIVSSRPIHLYAVTIMLSLSINPGWITMLAKVFSNRTLDKG